MGKLSYEDEMQIQTLHEIGFGYKFSRKGVEA